MKTLPILAIVLGLAFVLPGGLFAQTSEKREAPARTEAQKQRAERKRKEPVEEKKVMPSHRDLKKAPAKADPGAAQKVTWLGVATAPVPQSLREYLEVEPGFGVQIFKVVEDSPASEAGLKANDVLMLYGDQMLISPEHLSLLVKRQKAGEKVELTVIRKGAEKKFDVTLGGTDAKTFSGMGYPGQGRQVRPPFVPGNPHGRHWEEAMKRQQDHFQKWMKDRGGQGTPPAQGKPPALSVRPGFPVEVLTAEGVIKIDNEKGELIITNKDGEHDIVLKDESGKTVYEGEYDPEAGTEGLPEAARNHLKEMKLDDLKVLTPDAPTPRPENASQPLEEASLGEGGAPELL